jgi:hypothetical protein
MLFRESRNTFVRRMARSLLRKNCGSGWQSWARGHCTSNRRVCGRTDTVRASTEKLRDECLNGEIFYSLKANCGSTVRGEDGKSRTNTWTAVSLARKSAGRNSTACWPTAGAGAWISFSFIAMTDSLATCVTSLTRWKNFGPSGSTLSACTKASTPARRMVGSCLESSRALRSLRGGAHPRSGEIRYCCRTIKRDNARTPAYRRRCGKD